MGAPSAVSAQQPDFLAQKRRLEEEVQARNHSVIFLSEVSL